LSEKFSNLIKNTVYFARSVPPSQVYGNLGVQRRGGGRYCVFERLAILKHKYHDVGSSMGFEALTFNL